MILGFETLFFWLFAFLAVTGAVMVVVLRNPLSCALFLILTFVNLAGIYVLLQAHFVAVAQVLVYAGAIMVLFIFVIMLLNLSIEKIRFFDRHWSQIPGMITAFFSFVGFSGLFWHATRESPDPSDIILPDHFGTLAAVGELMLTKYLVPFELIAILLLVATVGAILLAKRVIEFMGLTECLILSAALFAIGSLGVLIRRNILVIFMSLELMLNAVNLAFISFSRFLGSQDGHVFVFFVIALAAAEIGLGLAIVIAIFRNRETVDVEHMRLMKW